MDHIHRYKRANIGSKDKKCIVFKCTKPRCYHHLSPVLLKDRVAECPKCNNEFIVGSENLRRADLICSDCIVRKNKIGIEGAIQLLEGLE